MSNISAYIILIIAVVLGTASNGFAKSAQGFTLLIPSILTAITIVGCMYALSLVMKTIPVGVTLTPRLRDYALLQLQLLVFINLIKCPIFIQ